MRKYYLKLGAYLFLLFNTKIMYAAIVIGNPFGSMTLVEIFDYQCPHCRAMNLRINQLIKTNPQLRVVLRVMPAFGDVSWEEARLALAARYQHKFEIFHHALMQLNFSPTSNQVLIIAKNIGLHIKQLEKDSRLPEIINELAQNQGAFYATGATGIPVLLIGYSHGDHVISEFVGETSNQRLQASINQLTREQPLINNP